MKNLLFLDRGMNHLGCTWIPTGDPKAPLKSVWIIPGHPHLHSSSLLSGALPSEEGHLCARCA